MTAPLTVRLFLCVSSFLSWSFHIWYKVVSSTCYIFSALFLFHWLSQVASNFAFTSETYVILLLLKIVPPNAAKNLLVKNVKHKLEWALLTANEEVFNWDTHFTQCRKFSTTSPIYLSLLPGFSRMTVETWLHFSLTTLKCLWTINLSWELEIFLLQVTSYKAPFNQF